MIRSRSLWRPTALALLVAACGGDSDSARRRPTAPPSPSPSPSPQASRRRRPPLPPAIPSPRPPLLLPPPRRRAQPPPTPLRRPAPLPPRPEHRPSPASAGSRTPRHTLAHRPPGLRRRPLVLRPPPPRRNRVRRRPVQHAGPKAASARPAPRRRRRARRCRAGARRRRAPPTRGVSATSIKLGHIGIYSGPVGSSAPDLSYACRASLQGVNDAGGMNGRKYDVLVRDDALGRDQGHNAVRDLVERQNVFALACSQSVPTNDAITPYLDSRRCPTSAATAGARRSTAAPGASRWGPRR